MVPSVDPSSHRIISSGDRDWAKMLSSCASTKAAPLSVHIATETLKSSSFTTSTPCPGHQLLYIDKSKSGAIRLTLLSRTTGNNFFLPSCHCRAWSRTRAWRCSQCEEQRCALIPKLEVAEVHWATVKSVTDERAATLSHESAQPVKPDSWSRWVRATIPATRGLTSDVANKNLLPRVNSLPRQSVLGAGLACLLAEDRAHGLWLTAFEQHCGLYELREESDPSSEGSSNRPQTSWRMMPLAIPVVRPRGAPALSGCSRFWRHETRHEATCHNRRSVPSFHRITRLLRARFCEPRQLKPESGIVPSREPGT